MGHNNLLTEAFRTYYDGGVLIELAAKIEAWAKSTSLLYERWKRPNKSSMKDIKVRSRTYHYEKATENNKFGPEWVLHGKCGARYGLFRGVNDEYIPLNLKTRKVVSKAGTFKATESGLVWSRDLSMLDKIINTNANVNESVVNESMLLNEGGAAAEALLPKLKAASGNDNLKYTKIPQSKLGVVFKEIIEPLLIELADKGFIDTKYKAEFGLGSTRLAAKIAGYDVKIFKSETPEVVAKAIMAKKSFGDLDIDVMLADGVELKDIAAYLENTYPEKFAVKPSVFTEICIAAVLDGDSVIQIDLVDLAGKKEDITFMQSSSMLDVSAGVEGAIQKWLIRAVLAVKEITPRHRKMVATAMKKNPEFLKWTNQGYVVGEDVGRYSMSTTGGIYLVIDLTKPGVKTKKSLKLTEEPLVKFSNIDDIIQFILPGADDDVANSAIKIAEYAKENLDSDKVDEIWQKFADSMSKQVQTMDPADYNNGMSVIAKIFGKPWNQGK